MLNMSNSMYYYVSGSMGMTSNGSFTKDKSRWIRFTELDKERYQSSGSKPYGATKRGTWVRA